MQMPTLGLANVIFGPIFFFAISGTIIPFIVAMFLETIILQLIRWDRPAACIADVFWANLLSSAVGFYFFFMRVNWLDRCSFWLAAWFASVVIEGLFLRWNRGHSLARSAVAALVMNTASYALLVFMMSHDIRQW